MKEKNIYVAGHNGMVGSALIRQLSNQKNVNLIISNKSDLNLLNQKQVFDFFKDNSIDEVYLAAAKVGGIQANNNFPAEFIYDNLMIQANVIHSAHSTGVNKLLFLGSSCIYPKFTEQPISENDLLTGCLETTNEPYAIAKIAGIKLCESYNRQYGRDYRSVMPTNLYGINDNFHYENSHVIPGLLRRFHDAKQNNKTEVVVWGSGLPRREFLFVDDMANASIYIMNLDYEVYINHVSPMNSHINVGTGYDCSIKELAEVIAKVVGYNGKIKFDNTKPDGTMRKLMSVKKLDEMGWKAITNLEVGLELTYKWFLQNQEFFRK